MTWTARDIAASAAARAVESVRRSARIEEHNLCSIEEALTDLLDRLIEKYDSQEAAHEPTR